MKHLIALVAFALIITACAAESSPAGARHCGGGLCIVIRAGGPVRINEPITVTATITSDKDYSQVAVDFYGDVPSLLIQGPGGWETETQVQRMDIKANQPASASREILIPQEGDFGFDVSAMTTGGLRVFDSIIIIVTKENGKVYLPGDTVPTAAFKFGSTVPPDQRPPAPLTPPNLVPTQPPFPSGPIPVITAPPPTSMFGIPPPTLPLTYTPAIQYWPTPPPPPAYP